MEERGSTSRLLRVRGRLGVALAVSLCAAGLAACGGGGRQDADEPEGEFQVEVVTAEFSPRQRLSTSSELELTVRNAGDEQIPNLAVTVTTTRVRSERGGATPSDFQSPAEQVEDAAPPEPAAPGSFSVLSDQKGLAIPSQSIWVLEAGYPKLAGEAGPGGAETALTNTFAFGPLDPGEERTMVWRVSPVVPGLYEVGYRVAAGLHGKAEAVTEAGEVPAGAFVVRIFSAPAQTRVNEAGEVVPLRQGRRARARALQRAGQQRPAGAAAG